MAWTREQIRAERERITGEISEMQAQIGVKRAELKVVQARCKHPDKHSYTVMGDSGVTCPDCGWST